MSQSRQEQPFKGLGSRLKVIRQKLQESVAEVSGAVEIDEKALERIEQGVERPSEDILMLLINHFGMREEEASSLWQLAGYDQPQTERVEDEPRNNRSASVLVMAIDPRIIYSDGVQVSANSQGVILGFSQGSGTPHSLLTARVGMSREQAQNVLRAIQQALQKTEPRQLSSGSPPETDA